jgi:hypothetical protein
VRASDGGHTGFGQAEVPDLARADQVGDGSGDILDRDVGVDAVLVRRG